jgi:hypothetical protein
MAEVEIERNEVEDPVLARQIEDEIAEAAAPAADPEGGLACSILDEGLHLEIEVEVPGFVETVTVANPAEPGTVGRAVHRVLRDLGLTAA